MQRWEEIEAVHRSYAGITLKFACLSQSTATVHHQAKSEMVGGVGSGTQLLEFASGFCHLVAVGYIKLLDLCLLFLQLRMLIGRPSQVTMWEHVNSCIQVLAAAWHKYNDHCWTACQGSRRQSLWKSDGPGGMQVPCTFQSLRHCSFLLLHRSWGRRSWELPGA